MTLKEEISEKCAACRDAVPIKVLDGGLIHLAFFYTPGAGAIGRCAASASLSKHLLGKDQYDNPIWDDEAKKAYEELDKDSEQEDDIKNDDIYDT